MRHVHDGEITLQVERLDAPGGIGLVLFIFGIGSVIAVVPSARYIDAHLRPPLHQCPRRR